MVSGNNYSMPPYKTGSSDITEWIERLGDYILACHGDACNDARKLAILKTVIGEEAISAIKNFSADEKDTYDHLTTKLTEHYRPAINHSTYRHSFYSVYQDEGEPVEDFVNRVMDLASKCGFRFMCTPATDNTAAVYHDMTSEFVRDRLIVGLCDEGTRARLMREKNLTLGRAVDLAKTSEAATEQLKQTARNSKSVHAMSTQSKGPQMNDQKSTYSTNKMPNRTKQNSSEMVKTQKCKYCGGLHNRGASNCPAFGKKCRNCNRYNHFENVCMQKKSVHELQYGYEQVPVNSHYTNKEHSDQPSSSEEWEIGLVCKELSSVNSNMRVNYLSNSRKIETLDWYENLRINGTKHNVKIDSGAQANVMSIDTVSKILPNVHVLPTNISLNAFGGFKIPVIGKINTMCVRESDNFEISHDLEFIVVSSKVKTVLGLDSSIKFNFINHSQVEAYSIDNANVSESCTETVIQTRSGSGQDRVITNLISEFRDVFNTDRVGLIKDCEYNIKLAHDAIPKISKGRPTPFAKKPKIEAELERMMKLDIIEPVDEPTQWVNNYVAVEKGDKTRICLDPSALNQYVQRERMQLPTIDDVYSEIHGGKLYSKLDLKDGYWQVPLSKTSQTLTTFQTHVGRYKYKRLPFGLNSANEVFQKRVTQVFGGIEGVIVMYDDVLVFSSTPEEHYARLRLALERAQKCGVKLNRSKCQFMLSEVKYLGHIISAGGIKVDPDKVIDLANMPAPQDKKGIQRLLGTLNFFSRYIPNMSTITHPLRELLGKNVPFHWTLTHDTAWKKIKLILSTAPVLGYYDVNKPVILQADASSVGLGSVILQDNKAIAYASRSLTTTQTHYAQIEKELLAIVFGCERFRQYLIGKEVLVHTDHKPLINTLNKPLFDNPKRIQRLLLRLQWYNLTLKYVPGKELHVPDMLSRACSVTSSPSASEKLLTDEADYQVHVVIQNLKCSNYMHAKIKSTTINDSELSQVKQFILNEWPQYSHDCPENTKLYWPIRAELSFYDGYILFHDRIVVPRALRAEILNRLHTGHQGRERCKRLARGAVFWPRINADIDSMVDKCAECLQQRNSPPRDELRSHTVPDRAWQKIGIDMFMCLGKRFQIVIDYFSKWIEVGKVPNNAESIDVIRHINELCTRFGYPEKIFSDGDPLYTSSSFKRFCEVNEIDHDFSSAAYPQSNGQSERAVQHVKKILRKCVHDKTDFNKALLMYRNTPLGDKLQSPAMLLFNRKLRTNVPCLNLKSENDNENRVKLEDRQLKSKVFHDKHIRTSNRHEFKEDELVQYKNSSGDKIWHPGQIVKFKTPQRSFMLQNTSGNLINRNRRLMIPDKCSKKLGYEFDIENQVAKHKTSTVPDLTSQAPSINPFTPPSQTAVSESDRRPETELRRSTRNRRPPQFYGEPIRHH